MGRRAPPRGGGCCAHVAFRLIFCQDPGSQSTSRSSESRASPAREQSPSILCQPEAGTVVFGLLKPQAPLAAPNATAVYASPDWLGVSKSRRAAPAAAVIAAGGACGGLLVPRVASAFQITRPCRRPSMPPSDMPVSRDWLGVSTSRRAARPAVAARWDPYHCLHECHGRTEGRARSR